MKATAFLSTAAVFHFALALGSTAFAAQKGTDVRPVPPKAKISRLTDGECYGLSGTIKSDTTCATGKSCTRVNGVGEVIRVGCIDNVKH